jgi:O-antigen ligase
MNTGGSRIAKQFNRERLDVLPDVFATGVAIALPWSTTATVVFVWLYLASLLPRLTLPGLRDAFLEPVSLAPTALFLFAALGMAWADVALAERLKGLSAFRFVLFIPGLVLHFRHSRNAHWVLAGFLASCSLLLVVSWAIHLFPPFHGAARSTIPTCR